MLRPRLIAEVLRLEKLQGLYVTTSEFFNGTTGALTPEAAVMLHISMNGTPTAPSLRLLTLAAWAPFDDSLVTTLKESNSNDRLFAYFRPVVDMVCKGNIVIDDRATVALPAIDYLGPYLPPLRESEPRILASLSDFLTLQVPMNLENDLRYLKMAVNTEADATVLRRLTCIEVLTILLPRDAPRVVATAVESVILLRTLTSLGITEISNFELGIPNHSVLSVEELESLFQCLPRLEKLELPLYPSMVVSLYTIGLIFLVFES